MQNTTHLLTVFASRPIMRASTVGCTEAVLLVLLFANGGKLLLCSKQSGLSSNIPRVVSSARGRPALTLASSPRRQDPCREPHGRPHPSGALPRAEDDCSICFVDSLRQGPAVSLARYLHLRKFLISTFLSIFAGTCVSLSVSFIWLGWYDKETRAFFTL